MPRFNPDNINIHDLTVEEPEKQVGLPFDPEKDLTDEYWEEVNKYVSSLRDLNHPVDYRWNSLLMALSNMKTLNKEEQLGKTEYDSMKNEVEKSKIFPTNFIEGLSRIKIIDPTIKIDTKGLTWEVIENWIQNEGYGRDIIKVAELKIAGFDKFKIDHDKAKQKVEDLLLTAREWDGNIGAPWYDFMQAASAAKIIYPDIAVKLTKDDWEAMKDECQGFLTSPFSHQLWSLHAAASMKVIAAEEVKVTENGLEINMRKSKDTEFESSELPKQRKF